MSEEYKRFTVSVPQDLYNDFEELRSKIRVSRSEMIRKAMVAYMISEENIPKSSGGVVGCITMIMTHEHFDLSHSHEHDEDEEDTDKDHVHDHEKDDRKHDHEFKSHPVYANKVQTDLILNNDIQHHYADIIISTMHVHLEFEKCMEIIAVSGDIERVKGLKNALQKLNSVLSIDFFIVDKK